MTARMIQRNMRLASCRWQDWAIDAEEILLVTRTHCHKHISEENAEMELNCADRRQNTRR
jgi:hypothetical protein